MADEGGGTNGGEIVVSAELVASGDGAEVGRQLAQDAHLAAQDAFAQPIAMGPIDPGRFLSSLDDLMAQAKARVSGVFDEVMLGGRGTAVSSAPLAEIQRVQEAAARPAASGLAPNQAQFVERGLGAGASPQDLATALGITVDEVKAFGSTLTEATAELRSFGPSLARTQPFGKNVAPSDLTTLRTDSSASIDGSEFNLLKGQVGDVGVIVTQSGRILSTFNATVEDSTAKFDLAMAQANTQLRREAYEAANPTGGARGGGGSGGNSRRLAGLSAAGDDPSSIGGGFAAGFIGTSKSGGQALASDAEFLGSIARYQLAYTAIYGVSTILHTMVSQVQETQEALVQLGTAFASTGTDAGDADQQAAKLSNTLAGISTAAGFTPASGIQTAAQGVLTFGPQIRGGQAGQQQAAVLSAQAATTAGVITGQNPVEAQQQVLAATQAFNLGAEGQTRVLDAATNAWKLYGGSIQDVLEALPNVAEVANQAGLSVEQTANIVALIGQRTGTGAASSGTQLSRIITQMEGGQFQSTERQLGVNPTGTQGQQLEELAQKWTHLSTAQQDATAKALTGSRGMSALLAILQDGGKALDQNADAYDAAGSAEDEYFRKLGTLGGQLQVIRGDLQEMLRELESSGLATPFALMFKSVEPVLKTLDDLLGVLDEVNKATHGILVPTVEVTVAVLALAKAYQAAAVSAAAATVSEGASGVAGAVGAEGGLIARTGARLGRFSRASGVAGLSRGFGVGSSAVDGMGYEASLGYGAAVAPAAGLAAGLVGIGALAIAIGINSDQSKELTAAMTTATAAESASYGATTPEQLANAASQLGKAGVDMQQANKATYGRAFAQTTLGALNAIPGVGLLHDIPGLGFLKPSGPNLGAQENLTESADFERSLYDARQRQTLSDQNSQSGPRFTDYFGLQRNASADDAGQLVTQGLNSLQVAGVPAHEQLNLLAQAMGVVSSQAQLTNTHVATTAEVLDKLAQATGERFGNAGLTSSSALSLSLGQGALKSGLPIGNVSQFEGTYNRTVQGFGLQAGQALSSSQEQTLLAAMTKAAHDLGATEAMPQIMKNLQQAAASVSAKPGATLAIRNASDLQDLMAGKSGATGGLTLPNYISAVQGQANPLSLSGANSSTAIQNQVASLLQGLVAQARQAGSSTTNTGAFAQLLEMTQQAVATAAQSTATQTQNLVNHLASLAKNPAQAAQAQFKGAIEVAKQLAASGDVNLLLGQLDQMNEAEINALQKYLQGVVTVEQHAVALAQSTGGWLSGVLASAGLAGAKQNLKTFNEANSQAVAVDRTPGAILSQGQDANTAAAAGGSEASQAAAAVKNDQLALQAAGHDSTQRAAALSQLAQDRHSLNEAVASEGEAAQQAMAVPGSQISAARVEIASARVALAAAASGSSEWYSAEQQLTQGMYDLSQAQAQFAQTAYLATHDTTDPVVQAVAAMRTANKELAAAERQLATYEKSGTSDQVDAQKQVVEAAQVAQRQAQSSKQQSRFSQNLTDAQNAHSLLLMSDSAYMEYLDTQDRVLRHQIAGMKVGTQGYRQALDDLTQIDQDIQSANQALSGQFNLGNIRIPTVYQARESVASSQAGLGPMGGSTTQIELTIVDQTDGGVKISKAIDTALGPHTVSRTTAKTARVRRPS